MFLPCMESEPEAVGGASERDVDRKHVKNTISALPHGSASAGWGFPSPSTRGCLPSAQGTRPAGRVSDKTQQTLLAAFVSFALEKPSRVREHPAPRWLCDSHACLSLPSSGFCAPEPSVTEGLCFLRCPCNQEGQGQNPRPGCGGIYRGTPVPPQGSPPHAC